jgi:hypothetical protein
LAWQAAVEALLRDDEELILGTLDWLDAVNELSALLDDAILVLLTGLLLVCIVLLATLLEAKLLLLTTGVEAVLELGVLGLDALETGSLALLLELPPSMIGPPPHPNSVNIPLKTISRNT